MHCALCAFNLISHLYETSDKVPTMKSKISADEIKAQPNKRVNIVFAVNMNTGICTNALSAD